ncbi:hypothetical protein CYMTET_21498 [Cymbomonas tetramitiformis]|uniref:Uncharacterized protein n=1 Tax=Cymbomonas tetramitiformis TaxID=36881 RepID=A0AAE0L2U0_9CHLO|nr:hypothetical protein CYMTET_21498 [Cymbomonas tetramitiformis]
MGLQTQTNTLRKMNALNQYGVDVQGVGNHMQELAKETLPIMKQLEKARRVYTDAEMEGTTRTNKYLRKMDEEYRDPDEQPITAGTEKLGAVNVIRETKTEQATKEITHAVPKLPGPQVPHHGGRENGITNNSTESNWGKEQERETLGIGPEDQEREEDDMMGEWSPPERTKRKIMQRDMGKWAEEEDPMEEPSQEGTHAPTRILACRQYLGNYTDMESKMVQYDTQWTDNGGGVLRTWSSEETIRTHLLARASCSDQGWGDLMNEWERAKQGKRTKRVPDIDLQRRKST